MDERQTRAAVFVVRMWHEAESGGSGRWRGSVDRIGSGARAYFSNVGTMCEFMLTERERASGPAEAPEPVDAAE